MDNIHTLSVETLMITNFKILSAEKYEKQWTVKPCTAEEKKPYAIT